MLIHLRKAGPEDALTLERLDLACGVGGWSKAGYRSALRKQEWEGWIALVGGEPAGYCLTRLLAPEMELMSIGVVPHVRRVGIATHLLLKCLDEGRAKGCTHCFLEVRKGNRAAISLYERNGFERLHLRERYYSLPVEDALVMRKRLKE